MFTSLYYTEGYDSKQIFLVLENIVSGNNWQKLIMSEKFGIEGSSLSNKDTDLRIMSFYLIEKLSLATIKLNVKSYPIHRIYIMINWK